MKVLLTGATGNAGSAALRRCLEAEDVEVTALVRRPLAETHPRLRTVVHEDFLVYDGLELGGFDACLWCLGIAQSKVSREAYELLTHDYALAAARALGAASPRARFCFLSGGGADPTEKSWMFFARVKGRTEKDLTALGTPSVVSFRPGYISPLEKRPERPLAEKVFGAVAPILRKVSRGMTCEALELADAMLEVARHGADKPVLENADIVALAARVGAGRT